MSNQETAMFCYQCEMSAPNGCGTKDQDLGTCGKTATLARLQDLMIFGLKGLAAYREHARELGATTTAIDDVISDTLYFTMTNVNFNFDQHIAQLMKIGQAGVQVMDLLSEAHTHAFGIPTPVRIPQNQAEGKAILITGHNLDLLKKLLEATENTGINIYTHSEMLPAHGYPELRKYPHLKGNIGGAWHDQTKLFSKWQGAIVVGTNCIEPLKPRHTYGDRLFTYKMVGTEGVQRIENDDFAPLIAKALSLPEVSGFDGQQTLVTGHHYKTILTLAPDILDAIKQQKVKQFFVIAGCDAPGKEGNYYREMATQLPQDTVVITSSCGKFRFNDIDFGTVPDTGIPRYLDLGQCNDSNGAVHVALALSQALNTPINDLPVAIVLSWLEQKAVIILLALFSLGIKNIYIGPKPPQFVNQDILQFLIENFDLHLTSDATTDLNTLLKKAA